MAISKAGILQRTMMKQFSASLFLCAAIGVMASPRPAQDTDLDLGLLGTNSNDIMSGQSLNDPPCMVTIHEIVSMCEDYLVCTLEYMKAQNGNVNFNNMSPEDLVAQVAFDGTFNACENVLNAIAAYKKGLQYSNQNQNSQSPSKQF